MALLTVAQRAKLVSARTTSARIAAGIGADSGTATIHAAPTLWQKIRMPVIVGGLALVVVSFLFLRR